MFTSVLIFKAIEKEIKSESNYWKLFPFCWKCGKITIGNLLNHRSGIYNFTSAPDYDSYSAAEN
jgi:CubicO group peptidase (beta-lactamase class C family)